MTSQIKNVKVSVSVYFAAALTFACIFAPGGYAPIGLLSCVLHECGHLAAVFALGGHITAVTLGAYGMRIDKSNDVILSANKEAAVAFAGPFVNLILTALGLALKIRTLYLANIAIAVFNLIPVESLDGYNIIYNLLCFKLEAKKLKAALNIISTAFLFVMFCLGFSVLLKSRYNFTVLAAAVYLSIRFVKSSHAAV
ncbi:MAG: hypothetical protein ACI4RB_07315 [Acutalibacteraceae bacterium]